MGWSGCRSRYRGVGCSPLVRSSLRGPRQSYRLHRQNQSCDRTVGATTSRRIVADQLSKRLGQGVGVGTAAARARSSASRRSSIVPDGYTLLSAAEQHLFNEALYKSRPTIPQQLVPVAIVYKFAMCWLRSRTFRSLR